MMVERQELPDGTRRCKQCRQPPEMLLTLEGSEPRYWVFCPRCRINGPKTPEADSARDKWNALQAKRREPPEP